jgi:tRNA U34 2-thiouridine synthase MnmA/TrmU
MSGGVDSSVAARLLLEQGYDVKPVFMRNWDTLDEQSGSGGCEWERDWDDVRRICREHLGGVEPELVDLSREYWTHVFEPALEEWAAGVTPNPDVTCNQCAQCNFLFFFPPSLSPADSLPDRPVSQYLICMLPRIRHIKFRILPERLLGRAPDAWIATGHYARLLPSPLNASVPALYRGNNIRKDQSHYLSTSPLSALQRTLFPLGDFASKDAVRDLARRWGMHTGNKKDSMGICFVGVRKGFSSFLGMSPLSSSPSAAANGHEA